MRMAAIYARVSSEQQREENTIASQTASLIEFASRHDLEVPGEAQKLDGVAWKSKPSSYIVATKDRTVQPELQRFVAKRMSATTHEVASSHVPMLSNLPIGLVRLIYV